MNFMRNESAQKLRGGYYTPSDIAAFLCRWVAGISPRDLLEPSAGDGAFLEAWAAVGSSDTNVSAIELNSVEAGKAIERARSHGLDIAMEKTDFLGWAIDQIDDRRRFDAVVGNPPFVRYQYLPPLFQHTSERIFRRLGAKFTKHTNAWVPFIFASMELLRPGGRLAMVVPAEIIHVLHAQSLRTYLSETCRRVVIVDPEEIWFEGTLQGAVILMAEKKGSPADHSEGLGLLPVRGRSFLSEDPEAIFDRPVPINGRTVVGKWTRAFLDPAVRDLLDELEVMPTVRRFSDVADVDVGIVTGANSFFLVDDATVERYGLEEYAHPMFGRSGHCPGVLYDTRQHLENSHAGLPANFIWFPDASVLAKPDVAEYIRSGEAQELHTRYKCRIRSPWFTVPSVYTTEIGMLKRAHDAPRLILNRVEAYTTDTAYRITAEGQKAETLVASFINPLTSLSAELEGRTYGGGVLELVPSEIEKLLIPMPRSMPGSLPALDRSVRTLPMQEILADHGRVVLEKSGIDGGRADLLLDAWIRLRNRRQRVASTPEADDDQSISIT